MNNNKRRSNSEMSNWGSESDYESVEEETDSTEYDRKEDHNHKQEYAEEY